MTMNFLELARARYSTRAYKPDEISADKLAYVLEAVRLAPTAANRQPFQLIIIHTQNRHEDLARIYYRPWFIQAPLVIGVCAVMDKAWVRGEDQENYGKIDAAIVMDHLTLAATEVGLGTCWVGAFKLQSTREVLGLPDNVAPVAFTPLGYPADLPRPKERKPLTELIRYERW